MNLEAPTELPVNLSHTSIDQFSRCQYKWFKRYILNEYEPPKGYFVLGRAVHAAESQSYSHMVETGEPHELEQVLDDFSQTIDNEIEQTEVEWEGEAPGTMKDRGASMLAAYHERIVPAMKPEKVENRFEVQLQPDYKWKIVGNIDVIGGYDNGFQRHPSGPHDIKAVSRAIPQADLDASIQATLYTYATMPEKGQEQTFRVHELRTTAKGAFAELKETTRTREAHMRYLERVAAVARQIDRNLQTGDWMGAPPSAFWCRQSQCGFWPTCPLATRA
jgi:hypothetical protein